MAGLSEREWSSIGILTPVRTAYRYNIHRTLGMIRSVSPQVTICLLTYGDLASLARRALDSIRDNCARADYRLVVGANAVCPETLELLHTRHRNGDIDHLIVSATNLSKCPMMRRMFANVETDYIWWFDDDSHVTSPDAMSRW